MILGHVVGRRIEVVRAVGMRIRVRALGVWVYKACRSCAGRSLELLRHHLEHIGERLSLDSLLLHHVLQHLVELHSLFCDLRIVAAL